MPKLKEPAIPVGFRIRRAMAQRVWPSYMQIAAHEHPLRYMFWEATLKCNLACEHCGSDCQRGSDSGLPASVVLSTFREVSTAFPAHNILVSVTGGEPLLRPDLFQITAELRQLGFRWALVTNGFAFDKAVLQEVVSTGASNVVVSLDGTRKSHDWLRGREGSFEQAVAALELCATSGRIPMVEAIMCVHPGNLSELDEVYALCRSLGVRLLRLFPIAPIGRAADRQDLLLNREHLVTLLDWIVHMRQGGSKGKKKLPMVEFCDAGFLGPYEGLVRSPLFFCSAGIHIAGLFADGKIGACPNVSRSMCQGKVPEDSFVQVWNEQFRPFRDREWLRKGACASCKSFRLCQGGSLHLADPTTGEQIGCMHPHMMDPGQTTD